MEKLSCFPLFFDLSDRRVLFVGGGKIAERRIKALLPFAGSITVTAPECTPALRQLAAAGEITWHARTFEEADLDGAAIVLAATGDEVADTGIWRLCRERGIWVNVASDKDKCDFYFPGIARRGSVVVGVTAGGADHKKARETTEAIRKLLDNNSTAEE